ncbi:YkgJ family cysteine cluster protein [Desulfovibrio sp. ZJ369]|uniref:YkgJ family cysteine cluster protein n=1 Tax=Desulfovibrio sp. ZJ369 TaxID=2709793 RepID=UPI0013EE28F2|nr:YkgJ family cysteine cluster protein [Desulfovibrio sp. ZJ369]
MTEWDAKDAALPCESAAERALSKAAYGYFFSPDAAGLTLLERHVRGEKAEGLRAAALVMQAANAELDEECREIGAIFARQGQTLACGPGCTGCCFQLVLCTPFEAALIGMYMRPRPDLGAFFLKSHQKWDAATKDFRESYLAWAIQRYRNGVNDGTHCLLDYYLACPFLDNGRCRIYPVRPYACRSCVAVSGECRSPTQPGEKPGMHNMELAAYTPHKKAREAALALLWKSVGLEPAQTRPRMLAELVRLWLESGAAAVLKACAAQREE